MFAQGERCGMTTARRAPGWTTVAAWVVVVLLLAVLVSATGCRAREGVAGSGGAVQTRYLLGRLEVDLGLEVTPADVAAAAEQSLRRRGYVVTSSRHTTDRSRVEGRSAGDGWLRKTVVVSRMRMDGTRVSVRVEPLGDEPVSYAVMDDLLARLGR